MSQFQAELDATKKILKHSAHGMSVTEIARALHKNQHSVGRYLDILLVSGYVEMRMYGKAKVYSLTSRVPLNTLMGGQLDHILVLDADNRVVRINDQFLQLVKKTRTDMLGKDITFIPSSEPVADQILTGIRTALESNLKEQEVVLAQDGRVYRQKIIPTVFEDGDSGTIIILENITEPKRAEQALRDSEEQFRLMAENIQDGILIYREKKLVYMNRRIEEIIGYSQKEFMDLSPLEITSPEDRDRISEVLAGCSSTGDFPSEIPFWAVCKDGTRRFVSSRITALRHQNETVVYIVITDMTEWKHAQDALENQLIFLQRMIDTFPNPLFYLDPRGRFLGCNSSFESLTGKKFEDLAGKTGNEIGDFGEKDLFSRYNTELFEQPGVRKYTGRFHNPDGHVSRVTIQKSPMTGLDGTPAGIIGIILSSE